MELFVSLFPFLVFLAFTILVGFYVWLGKRRSRGSTGPGPRETALPQPPGLKQTPWELESINQQVKSDFRSPARQDLIQTLNQLAQKADPSRPAHLAPPQLPWNADEAQIVNLVTYLKPNSTLTAPSKAFRLKYALELSK